MTKTQEIYKKAKEAGKVSERVPWLELGKKKEGGGVMPTGEHIVKFLDDKIVKGRDYQTKEERPEIEYYFEEDGEEKRYRVPIYEKISEEQKKKGKEPKLHYLAERMKDFNYGDILSIEMKWNGERNVVYVELASKEIDNDIPIINEDGSSELDPDGSGTTTRYDEINPNDLPF